MEAEAAATTTATTATTAVASKEEAGQAAESVHDGGEGVVEKEANEEGDENGASPVPEASPAVSRSAVGAADIVVQGTPSEDGATAEGKSLQSADGAPSSSPSPLAPPAPTSIVSGPVETKAESEAVVETAGLDVLAVVALDNPLVIEPPGAGALPPASAHATSSGPSTVNPVAPALTRASQEPDYFADLAFPMIDTSMLAMPTVTPVNSTGVADSRASLLSGTVIEVSDSDDDVSMKILWGETIFFFLSFFHTHARSLSLLVCLSVFLSLFLSLSLFLWLVG